VECSNVAAVCCCAGLMIKRTQRAALERRGWGASGAGLLWLNEAAPSLRSNIPQTALVATLDTYDLFRFPISYFQCYFDPTPTKSALFSGNLSIFCHRCKSYIQISYMLQCHFDPTKSGLFLAICQFSVIFRCIRKINSIRLR
jgi:hypothetical protein